MLFMVGKKPRDIFRKYNEIWNRVEDVIEIFFYIEVIHDDEYTATRINPFKDKIKTDFLSMMKEDYYQYKLKV